MPRKGSKVYNQIVGIVFSPEGEIYPTEGGKLSKRLLEEFQYDHNMNIRSFWKAMKDRGAPLSGYTENAINHGVFDD